VKAIIFKKLVGQVFSVLLVHLIQIFGNVTQLLGHLFGSVVNGPVNLHMEVSHGIAGSGLDGGIFLNQQGVVYRQ